MLISTKVTVDFHHLYHFKMGIDRKLCLLIPVKPLASRQARSGLSIIFESTWVLMAGLVIMKSGIWNQQILVPKGRWLLNRGGQKHEVGCTCYNYSNTIPHNPFNCDLSINRETLLLIIWRPS